MTVERFVELTVYPISALFGVIVLALIFRVRINEAIGRVEKLSKEGAVLSSPNADQQKTPAPAVQAPSPSNDALPAPSQLLKEREAEITRIAGSPLHYSESALVERYRRVAANALFQHRHEIVYRWIFGSQLNFLLVANTRPVLSHVDAQTLFDLAKGLHAEAYANTTIEHWIGFMKDQNLIKEVAGGYSVTDNGRDFMHYLVTMGLTGQKDL